MMRCDLCIHDKVCDAWRYHKDGAMCENFVNKNDAAPVKHGRWYNRGGRFRCSVCDNKTLLKDIGGTGGWSHEYEQQKSPYCPNCGAKMDGGENNGNVQR